MNELACRHTSKMAVAWGGGVNELACRHTSKMAVAWGGGVNELACCQMAVAWGGVDIAHTLYVVI